MAMFSRSYVEDRASTAPVIGGSVVLSSGESEILTRTPSSIGNRRTWIWSCAIKLLGGGTSSYNPLFVGGLSGGGGTQAGLYIQFTNTGALSIGDQVSNSFQWNLVTTAQYRDYSGWYNLVIVHDTTQALDTDRVKVYFNGEQVTSFSTASYPTLNYESNINKALPHRIGASDDAGSIYLPMDSYLSNINFIDGQSAGPGYFGYTDPLTNTWRPKIFDWSEGTVNNGTVWSNKLTTSTGSFTAGYGAIKAFDGKSSTYAGAGTGSATDWIGVPSGLGFKGTHTVEIKSWTTKIEVNGQIVYTNAAGGTTIQTFVVTSFDSFKSYGKADGSKADLTHLKVDGVELMDGKGSGFNKNPNCGTVWSDVLTSATGAFWGSDPAINAFNGTLANFAGSSNSAGTLTFTVPSSLKVSSSQWRLYVNTSADIGVDGSTVRSGDSQSGVQQWCNLGVIKPTTITVTGTITTANLWAIEVDGYVLIDSTVDNSFYLPMDGSAPIGEDQSGIENIGSVQYKVFNNSTGTNINYFTDTPEATGILNSLDSAEFSYTLTSKHAVFDLGPSTARRIIDEITGSGGWVLVSDDGSTWTQLGSANISGTNSAYMPNFSSPVRYFSFGGGGGVGACTLTLDETSNNKFVGAVNEWTPVNFGGSAPLDKATGGLPILNTVNGGNISNAGIRSDYGPNTAEIVKQSGCVAFDGTGDYLRIASSSDFDQNPGTDFTAECFFYMTEISGPSHIFGFQIDANNRTSLYFTNNTDTLNWWTSLGGSNGNRVSASNVAIGAWHHVAVTRSGSTTTMWLDGVSQGTSTTTDYPNGSQLLDIGTYNAGGSASDSFPGFISNVRYVKGTAVYTSDFTPPTSPLTNITNTKLLCCQSNNQSSSASVAPTVSGINDGTQWSAYMEPGGPTNFIKPGSYGPYTNFITNARRAFDGDLTTTCWADSATGSASAGILNWEPPSPITISSTLKIYGTYHGTGVFYINGTDINSQLTQGASSSWFTITGFSSIENISLHASDSSNTAHIRAIEVDGVVLIDPMTPYGDVYGSDSELSGSCTLALPLDGDANDVSNQINSGSTTKTITVTNAVPNYVYSNFYGGSYSFDGSGDYIVVTNSSDFVFEEGSFTIECWMYADSYMGLTYPTVISKYDNGDASWILRLKSDGDIVWYAGQVSGGTNNESTTQPISLDQWHHLAVVREGTGTSETKVYVDGILQLACTDTSDYDDTNNIYIGRQDSSNANEFDGYIQDVRIYKGVTKYTSNFIPVSKDPNIVLDSPSGAAYSTQLAKITNGAVSFDGTGDYLSITSEMADFQFGTGDFTIESYVLKTANGANGYDGLCILGPGAGSGTTGYYFEVSATRGLYFIINTNSLSSNTWVNDGMWHHVAVTRSSGTVYLFLDGIVQASGSLATSVPTTGTSFNIGNEYNGTTQYSFNGLISNFRLTKGEALYTSNFTPPTGPLTPSLPWDSSSELNDGKIWSNNGSYVIGHTSHRLPKAFDGSTAANDYAMVADSNGDTGDLVVTLPGLPSGKTVRFFGYRNTSGGVVTFNDGAVTLPTGYGNQAWVTAANTTNGSTDSFTMETTNGAGGSDEVSVFAVEVDGVVLVDGPTKLLCCQSTTSAIESAVIPNNSAELNAPLFSVAFTDSSTRSKTITNTGSITTASAGTNSFNITNAASFDGSSQRLNTPQTGMTFTGSFTLDTYIKLDASAANYNIIINTGYRSGSDKYIYIGLDDDEKPYIEDVGTTGSRTTATSAISKDTWYHLRVTQGDGNMKLYVNGTVYVTHTTNTYDMVTGRDFTIGSAFDNNNNTNNFHGLIGPTRYVATNLGAPTAGGDATTDNDGALSNLDFAGFITSNGDAVATNFNLFNTDIDTVMGQETGYATLNPLDNSQTLSNGNLDVTGISGNWRGTRGTIGMSSGKFYWEWSIGFTNSGSNQSLLGIAQASAVLSSNYASVGAYGWEYYSNSGQKFHNGSNVSYGDAYTIGDVIGASFDADNGKLTFYKNGISQGEAYNSLTSGPYYPSSSLYGTSLVELNFGQKPFKYAPPQGFQPLNSANLPSPAFVRPDSVVGVVTYTGTSAPRSVSLNTKPDFIWIKNTTGVQKDVWVDSVRTTSTGEYISSNGTDAQGTGVHISGFEDGIDIADPNASTIWYNDSGYEYVAWAWKAGGGPTPATDLVFGVDTDDNTFDDSTTSTITKDVTGYSFGSYSIPQSHPGGTYQANSTQVYKSSSGQMINWSVSTSTASKFIWTSDNGINWTNNNGTSQYDTTTNPVTLTSKWIVLSGGANAATITVTGDGHLFRKDGIGCRTTAIAGLDHAGSDYDNLNGTSVGTKQGFSIVRYIGEKPTVLKIPHGLTQAPDFVVIKNLTNSGPGFIVYHKDLADANSYLRLNEDSHESSTGSIWNSTYPSSTVVTVGADTETNGASNDMIMYAWHDVPGLQRFGKYTGNGSTDGPFVELGFRPAIVIIKNISYTGHDWVIFDDKINSYNPSGRYLEPNSNVIIQTDITIDLLSNGFKVRTAGGSTPGNTVNYDTASYVYMAWASTPSSNLYRGQATAR